MTTYTTPHFATGIPQRSNVRTEPSLNRARPAPAAAYSPIPASTEAAALADGPTPDWQPGAAQGGVPKAAIGTLGAALVAGVALAIVFLAPSNKVTKQVAPDPIAQATAQTADAAKPVDGDAAFNKLEGVAPVPAAAPATTAAPTEAVPAAPAVPAPVQSVTTTTPPVANAPVARLPKQTPAPIAAQRVAPVQAAPTQAAPVVTPDLPAPAPVVTPPADVQAPAMTQTPEPSTVTPSVPAPAPEQPTQDTGSPTPAPAQ